MRLEFRSVCWRLQHSLRLRDHENQCPPQTSIIRKWLLLRHMSVRACIATSASLYSFYGTAFSDAVVFLCVCVCVCVKSTRCKQFIAGTRRHEFCQPLNAHNSGSKTSAKKKHGVFAVHENAVWRVAGRPTNIGCDSTTLVAACTPAHNVGRRLAAVCNTALCWNAMRQHPTVESCGHV